MRQETCNTKDAKFKTALTLGVVHLPDQHLRVRVSLNFAC